VSPTHFDQDLIDIAVELLESKKLGKLCTSVPANVAVHESPQSLAGQSVSTLNLSTRASNCLETAGIGLIGDLLRWSPIDLMTIPNFGDKCRNEIIVALRQRGIPIPCENEVFVPGPPETISPELSLKENEFRIESLLTLTEARVKSLVLTQFQKLGIETLGGIASLEARFIRKSANLMFEDIAELAKILRSRSLRWGMSLPVWQTDHTTELRQVFGDHIWQLNSSQTPTPREIPQPGSRELANSLTEELELIFPPRTDPRKRKIAGTYLGLDGEPPRTLESVAVKFGMTRERVRQIALPFEKSLEQAVGQLLWLEEALSVVSKRVPCRSGDAEQTLQAKGIVTSPLSIETLLKLADRAHLKHALTIPLGTQVVFTEQLSHFIEEARVEALRQVSHWGVADRSEIIEKIKLTITDEDEKVFWQGLPSVVWLCPERKHLWLPTGKNAVANRLAKILLIARELSQQEAYDGVFRDNRVSGERLPFTVFATFCRQYAWCEVNGEYVRAGSGVPVSSDVSDDDKLVELLRETGGTAWRQDLWTKARSIGIGRPSFERLLSDSNLIIRHGENLYAIIGTPVIQLERIRPRAENLEAPAAPFISEELCTQPDDSSDVLGGVDPSSDNFPFELLLAVIRRSRSFERAWSVSELKLTPADRQTVIAWGKSGNLDLKLDSRRTEIIHGVKLWGRYAIAATFLLFCSEVARLEGIEGEVWPFIYASMNERLRHKLFAQPSLPKQTIRDATEETCRWLRVRHVFGREGEQSWMRTLFLQFGISRNGMDRLHRWLSSPDHLPVAVEELLNSESGLHSESFCEMWQTLLQLRVGATTVADANRKLTQNPWSPKDQRQRMLDIVASNRTPSTAIDDDGDIESNYRILLGPRLSLGNEPEFQFTLNQRPPSWCDQQRYFLQIGKQRVPILRTGDNWKFEINDNVSVTLESEVIEIDLRHKNVSTMLRPLKINLSPLSGFVFYDLKSGIEIDSEDLANQREKGVSLLCRRDVEILPEPSQVQLVFGGLWQLVKFPSGLPKELLLSEKGEPLWEFSSDDPGLLPKKRLTISVTVSPGWWGQNARAVVTLPAERIGNAKRLVMGGQSVSLAEERAYEFNGMLRLTPEVESSRIAQVLCAERNRLKWRRANVIPMHCAGAAVQGEQSWMVLDDGDDLEINRLYGRKVLIRPPGHGKNGKEALREWAIVEGDVFIGRPGRRAETLQGLYACGQPLSLAYGPYNSSDGWHQLCRAVVDSGCIRDIEFLESKSWNLLLTEEIGIGENHGVWVWYFDAHCPERLPNGSHQVNNGILKCLTRNTDVLGFAVSYGDVCLGSRSPQNKWADWRTYIERSLDWALVAKWLRWWRLPILHTELRSTIEAKVRQHPVDSLVAWLANEDFSDLVGNTDAYESAWSLIARTCLWEWVPKSTEAADLFRKLSIWTGGSKDFECGEYDLLLNANPMLLAETAHLAAPIIYPGARQAELITLLSCLRDRTLGVPEGQRWNDVYRKVCREASIDLNVDERFLEKSVIQDARSYIAGRQASRNLKLALGSMLVRRLLASRILEDYIERRMRA